MVTHTSSMTENERHVLLWLLHHPLQRIRDIALGLDITESTSARLLQKLRTELLVEEVTPRLSISNRHGWYYLTTSGLREVAELEGGDPVTLARTWAADERHLLRLLPRLHQIIHLQNIVHSLMSSAPTTLSYKGYQAEIRWGWQREYRVTFRRRQQAIHCEADAVVVFRRRASATTPQANSQDREEQFFTLFVYLDLGERCAFTDRATMIRKLRNLLLYRESRERQPYRSMFPSVLIVVESAHQLELWQQAAGEAARQLHLGKPLLAVIVNQAEEPRNRSHLIRSLWQYRWRVLSTHAFCRLEQMLQPMHAAAVPPGILTRAIKSSGADNAPSSKTRSHTNIVQGQYQKRMEALLNLPQRAVATSIRQEREIMALLSLQMSHRYREILLTLYTHPLLESSELAVLSGLQAETTARYIRELAHWGYLQRFSRLRAREEPEQTEERKKEDIRWALSVRGLLYLAASTATPPRKLYQQERSTMPVEENNPQIWQRGVRQLYREWNHTVGIYQCLMAFHNAAQSQPSHHITWFETHFRCARHYQMNKKWHNFRPDAVLEYVVKEDERIRRFHLWIEWDNGTMGTKALIEKMQTYHFYLRSLEWRRQIHTEALPLLLIIVPDRSRISRMTRLVRAIFGDSALLPVRITTQDLLHEHSPLASIWTDVVPSPARSHLRALLDVSFTRVSAPASLDAIN